LILMEHVAIQYGPAFCPLSPHEVVDAFHALQVHGQSLESVSNFTHGGVAIQPPYLLEVSELSYFHSVKPDFPAQAPCAQSGVLPVVLDEADVVLRRVDTQGFERVDVDVKNV